jgi:hypothetical protein
MRLERGPLSLVSTTEELLERKSSGSGLENLEYSRKGSVTLTTWQSLSAIVGTNFIDKVVARSVWFARGLQPRSYYYYYYM